MIGIGESYGGARALNGMKQAADALIGLDPFQLNALRARVETALPNAGGINATTMLTQHQVVDAVYSAFELALLDIQGKLLERSLCDLLDGAVKERVGFSGYLFYKFAKPAEYRGEDLFGEFCRAVGLGISMHSNTHLGISLAAMVHVAAATPDLTYDCDTHYPWRLNDIIKGGKMRIENGSIAVPACLPVQGLGLKSTTMRLTNFTISTLRKTFGIGKIPMRC